MGILPLTVRKLLKTHKKGAFRENFSLFDHPHWLWLSILLSRDLRSRPHFNSVALICLQTFSIPDCAFQVKVCSKNEPKDLYFL